MKKNAQLGQVFTPPEIVRRMFALRRNFGRVLEPSAGDGAFLRLAENATGIEIDPRLAGQSGALCADFFDYADEHKFDTIVGNPPYVRHQDIPARTREKLRRDLFDGRSNLYLFFIEKCLRHLRGGGELIFITPRDFLRATAARRLNRLLYESGTITDFIELGDARVFSGASPNCAIWRFVKGDFSRRANGGRETFFFNDGQIFFARGEYAVPCRDIFRIKVGAVSGMDSVFADEKYGNRSFVCSRTAATGETRRMIYDSFHPVLRRHKQILMARKIRRFDETNWWRWGRAHFESDRPRVYVNAKTRAAAPFFLHSSRDYDGSVLAVFPRDETADLRKLRDKLNAVNWRELGFVCGGRFLFAQRGLQNCLLPKSFAADAD
ncbi:MAG: Eco57I restriction-modification methylase domain-containing protein [Gammaproteobacteria bacterium]